jgi:hypothetical protein
MLTLGERVLLLVHCGDHPIADCSRCGELIHFDRLVIDIAAGCCDSCPRCQLDLTAPLRKHLVECTWIRVRVRETHTRAWVLLEEARTAGTINEQRRDRADVLGREAEAERHRSRDVKRGQNPGAGERANALNVRPGVAELIRAKLLIGRLRRRTATRSTAADLQREVDAIGLRTLRFHTRLGHAPVRGTRDRPTASIARLGHSRNGRHPKVVRPGGRSLHRGRGAAMAAAVVAIMTVSALGDRPTVNVGRYGVSHEPAVSREVTPQALRSARRPFDETPRPLTTNTRRPRVATSKPSRPLRALQAPTPRVLVPAVASTSPTSQVPHQAP